MTAPAAILALFPSAIPGTVPLFADGNSHTIAATLGPQIAGFTAMTPAAQLAAVQAFAAGFFGFAATLNDQMDRLMIQQAVSLGGRVVLPAGRILLDAQVILPVTVPLVLTGAGDATYINPTHDFGPGMHAFAPAAHCESADIVVSYMRIGGSCAPVKGDLPGPNSSCWQMGGIRTTHMFHVDHVSFDRLAYGIGINENHSQITHCRSGGCAYAVRFLGENTTYGNNRFVLCNFTGATIAAFSCAWDGSMDWTIGEHVDCGHAPYGILRDDVPIGPVPYAGGTLTSANGPPPATLGAVGDNYVDRVTRHWYVRGATGWAPKPGATGGLQPSFLTNCQFLELNFEGWGAAMIMAPGPLDEIAACRFTASFDASYDPAQALPGVIPRFIDLGIIASNTFEGGNFGYLNPSLCDSGGLIRARSGCGGNVFRMIANPLAGVTPAVPFLGGSVQSNVAWLDESTRAHSTTAVQGHAAGDLVRWFSPHDGRTWAMDAPTRWGAGVALGTATAGQRDWVIVQGNATVSKTPSVAIAQGDIVSLDPLLPAGASFYSRVGAQVHGGVNVGVCTVAAPVGTTQVQVYIPSPMMAGAA